MKKIIRKPTFLLLVSLFLSACNNQVDKGEEISGQIQAEFPSGDTIKNGEMLGVWIHNDSPEKVCFPVDYHIQVFMENNGDAKMIGNNVRYLGSEEIILEPSGSIFSYNTVIIAPAIPEEEVNQNTVFFATIDGYLCNDINVTISKKIPFSVDMD